ncbi:Copper chaperone CopZ [compost metagenome]
MKDRLMDRIEHLKETSLVVEDLTCKHCIRNLLDELRTVDGVVAARVNAPPVIDEPPDVSVCGTATVKFNPEFVTPQRIRETIEHQGFRVIRFQSGD